MQYQIQISDFKFEICNLKSYISMTATNYRSGPEFAPGRAVCCMRRSIYTDDVLIERLATTMRLPDDSQRLLVRDVFHGFAGPCGCAGERARVQGYPA